MDQKAKILDIAMNLNRIGNWSADGYKSKRKRIIQFLDQTTQYIQSINSANFSNPFKKTFSIFLEKYKELEAVGRNGPKDELYFAEMMMTWGNILTHRSSLIRD